MEPFDSIEKLISEHGSAAILRDHITLLKSQMDALKSENAGLESKLRDSEFERNKFKVEAEKLQAELDDALAVIKRYNESHENSVSGGEIKGAVDMSTD